MKYYSLEQPQSGAAELYIYGDITSYPWDESDVSAYNLAKELDGIASDKINVYINSYGGETAEGLAIYNALKRHTAHVTTICDGFACSSASIIFMAGDERVMGDASLLMIHNAWTYTAGNADELRKEADDLEKISKAASGAYSAAVSIDDAELQALLEAETWLTPNEALEKGFATSIVSASVSTKASMSARKAMFSKMTQSGTVELENAETTNDKIVQVIKSVLSEYGIEPEKPKQEETKKFFNWRTKE